MSGRSLILASLIGGVAIAILSNVPVVNLANCLLCLWVWLGAIFAVWLYRRFAGGVGSGEGAVVGALAGFIAGLLGGLIQLATAAAMQDSFQALFQLLPPDLRQSYILSPLDFSGLSILMSCVSLFLYTGIGVLAGLIGAAIFRTPAMAASGSTTFEPIPPPAGGETPPAAEIQPGVDAGAGSEPAIPGEPQPPPEMPAPREEQPGAPPDASLSEASPPGEPPAEPPA